MDSFGSILGNILQEHGISASEAARRLGMRSKTSLMRILKDQTGYATVRTFWEQLLAGGELNLSDCEQRRLQGALEVMRVGAEVYNTNCALQHLLQLRRQDVESVPVKGLPGINNFSDLCRLYADAEELEITLMGLCDVRLFHALQQMCSRMPAARQPQITHYIYSIDDTLATIRSVCAIFPVIFHRNYTARMIPVDPDMYFPGEMMLCRFRDAQGEHYHQLAFAGQSVLQGIAYSDRAAYDYWQTVISANGADLPLLKAAFPQEHSPDEYLAYMEYVRHLESGRNIYMVKPDIPICVVPAPILYQSVIDNPAATEFVPAEELRAGLEPLYRSHEQRHLHLFHRRKVTHMIFSRAAMMQFALTGRQSDHFYAARAFTPQERAQILQLCLDASLNNPYFNIYFSNSDLLASDSEITCYEGKCTVLLNAHTSYRLTDDHSEALITHEGFNEQFRQYYVGELLRSQVLPAAEGHAYLRSLIQIALEAE